VATLQALARSADVHERLWAMHGLALSAPTLDEEVAIYRRAIAIKPDFLPAVGNLALAAEQKGHEEEALHALQRSGGAFASGEDDYTRDYSDGFALDAKGIVAALTGDLPQAAAFDEQAEQHGGGPVIESARPFATAEAFAQSH